MCSNNQHQCRCTQETDREWEVHDSPAELGLGLKTPTITDVETNQEINQVTNQVTDQVTDQVLASSNSLMSQFFRQKAINKVYELLEVYRNSPLRSSQLFKDPEINFKLRSTKIAGQATYPTEISFNPYYLEEYRDDFINTVVGHELAHFLVFHHISTGELPRRCQPHGKEWRAFMELFNLPPDVYHQFSTPPALTQKKNPMASVNYFTCLCMVHTVSPVRYKKIKDEGTVYLCNKCKTSLVEIPEEKLDMINVLHQEYPYEYIYLGWANRYGKRKGKAEIPKHLVSEESFMGVAWKYFKPEEVDADYLIAEYQRATTNTYSLAGESTVNYQGMDAKQLPWPVSPQNPEIRKILDKLVQKVYVFRLIGVDLVRKERKLR